MSNHLDAEPGEIAPIVLLPGDPVRAQFIAERFLEGARCHNRRRGALGFTGRYRGAPLSVQSTGMGMPSAAIYAHELLTAYGARVLLRVGTCGAIHADVALGDVVLAMGASTDSAMIAQRFMVGTFAPLADFGLLSRAHALGRARGRRIHVGNVLSSDTFYADDPCWWEPWAAHGVLAAEMETAALYTVAARQGSRALSLLAASDHILREEQVSPEDREGALGGAIELALELAAELAAEATASASASGSAQ